MQEEVEGLREVVDELRTKYKGALEEIKDLEFENENKHAEILDDLRGCQNDLGLYRGIVDMLLSPHEFAKIKQKCEFDEDKDEWSIPPFYMKGKEVQLPKLGLGRAQAVVEQEKNNRELAFEAIEEDPYDYNGYEEGGQQYGDRIESRGAGSRKADKGEFRVSKKKKKRKKSPKREIDK